MGIAKNVLVRIDKFIFRIDFIILNIPQDDDVPLILGLPFLSTAHAKMDVFKRKITLNVEEEKIVFKSIKPATSIIKRVYMLSTNLDSKTKLRGEAVNESFDPNYGDYIELNDLDMPLEPKMNQDN
nr:putative reverse transcriptase domain-containing protein [Tanacetum cinerariifolium]